MAIFSVKLQRGSIYFLCLASCVLLYQIYSHKEHGRSIKQDRSGIGFYSQPDKFRSQAKETSRNTGGNSDGTRVKKNSHSMEHGSGDFEKEIKALRTRLKERENLVKSLTRELKKANSNQEKLSQEIKYLKKKTKNAALLTHVEEKHAQKSSGRTLSENVMEISKKIPFQSFAKTHVYESESRPKPKEYIFHGQRKEGRTVKPEKRHIIEAQTAALEFINLNNSHKLTIENMVDGVYRVDVNTGIDYEMYFKYPRSESYAVVQMQRALGPVELVLPTTTNRKPDELINLILPLSGRLERFQQFLEMFTEVCIQADTNIFLTVVLYGAKDFEKVRDSLKNLENTYNYKKYQLIMRDKSFSRGRTLHDGVMYWTGKNDNVLMFFCDVDITFSVEFLRRCRMYTEPEKSVYYPMVFSLYNPRNVYEDGNIPTPQEQLKIDKSHGFWRTYGFGMTCQYRADYLRAGGFDLSIEGWGSEDQLLYQQHLAQPHMRIIRAPDRDLFHYYHDKQCDPSLKWEQYRSCLGSKATAEGTLAQISTQLIQLREKYEPSAAEDVHSEAQDENSPKNS